VLGGRVVRMVRSFQKKAKGTSPCLTPLSPSSSGIARYSELRERCSSRFGDARCACEAARRSTSGCERRLLATARKARGVSLRAGQGPGVIHSSQGANASNQPLRSKSRALFRKIFPERGFLVASQSSPIASSRCSRCSSCVCICGRLPRSRLTFGSRFSAALHRRARSHAAESQPIAWTMFRVGLAHDADGWGESMRPTVCRMVISLLRRIFVFASQCLRFRHSFATGTEIKLSKRVWL